jgi:hypothetical protein
MIAAAKMAGIQTWKAAPMPSRLGTPMASAQQRAFGSPMDPSRRHPSHAAGLAALREGLEGAREDVARQARGATRATSLSQNRT